MEKIFCGLGTATELLCVFDFVSRSFKMMSRVLMNRVLLRGKASLGRLQKMPISGAKTRLFSSSSDLWLTAGERWVSIDPNEETRRAVSALVEAENVDELQRILESRLAFGTAGLRGVMGPGYNHMNDLVILQTAQGLCQ